NRNGNKAKITSRNKNWNPTKVQYAKPPTKNDSGNLFICFKCGKSGHMARKCRNQPVDHPPQANMVEDPLVAVLISWKSRLSERFSPERERITWEGEILGYTGGFSPERELSRLGEKWQFWAVNPKHILGLELEEKREKGAFQEQGALGHILELEKRDPKVGGDRGGNWCVYIKEGVDLRKRKINTLAQVMKQYFGSSYVAMLWLKLCSNTLAQVLKQYFGSSYVAMLWLKLCCNTLAQVMKQYFGSSYVAMCFGSSYVATLWLNNALAQAMLQHFGSSYEAILWLKLCSNVLWLKLCSNTLAQVMKQYFGSSYVAMLWLKLCSNTLAQVMKQYFGSSYVAMLWLKLCSNTLAQAM
ncbi:hypothetical protein Lal_00032199, partial [Lupinus albus]